MASFARTTAGDFAVAADSTLIGSTTSFLNSSADCDCESPYDELLSQYGY